MRWQWSDSKVIHGIFLPIRLPLPTDRQFCLLKVSLSKPKRSRSELNRLLLMQHPESSPIQSVVFTWNVLAIWKCSWLQSWFTFPNCGSVQLLTLSSFGCFEFKFEAQWVLCHFPKTFDLLKFWLLTHKWPCKVRFSYLKFS